MKKDEEMKPTPFDPEMDYAPIPFDPRHCLAARSLKEAGLQWRPHVGCFVWDGDGDISVSSPFPGHVYFVLNLHHFLKIFGSEAAMIEKLVWLPTWHQARLLCNQFGVSQEHIADIWNDDQSCTPGEDLLALYGLLHKQLRK